MANRAVQHQPKLLRRLGIAAALLLASVLLVAVLFDEGAGPKSSAGSRRDVARHAQPVRLPVARKHGTKVRRRVASARELDELAGQRIVYAYSGLNPPASLLARIRAGEAAGVILFGPNIGSSSQVQAVVAELQNAARASPIRVPLLIMVDQEGGLIRRLPGPPQLSEKQIGASPDAVRLAHQAGSDVAAALAALGVNVNLAPVLDVFRRPQNFIDQYQRSYGSDPLRVGELAGQFIAAQQANAVAATAKHFPGLGAATRLQNTDAGPASLGLPLQQLRGLDEVPYRYAIAAGVRLVMLSWATYPALDAARPAGLSTRVIVRELRNRLHFGGVTITDALGARALYPFGGIDRRAVLAAKAGADLLLCAATNVDNNTPADGITALHALATALRERQLSARDATASAMRIRALRARS